MKRPNSGFVLWLFVGLIGGSLLGIVTMNLWYDVNLTPLVVLATPPSDEPQVCHMAKIVKKYPVFDCVTKEPIEPVVEEPPLGKDAVYAGSLTFAGLVVFSSAILAKAFDINRQHSWPQKIGSLMVTGGSIALALFHVAFAFTYGQGFLEPWIAHASVILIGVITIGGGYLTYTSKTKDTKQS